MACKDNAVKSISRVSTYEFPQFTYSSFRYSPILRLLQNARRFSFVLSMKERLPTKKNTFIKSIIKQYKSKSQTMKKQFLFLLFAAAMFTATSSFCFRKNSTEKAKGYTVRSVIDSRGTSASTIKTAVGYTRFKHIAPTILISLLSIK